MQCPRCQHENPPQAKFCLECGARVALTCTKCRSELPAGAKFCLECGEAVSSQATAEPRFASPGYYTPKHLAEKILTSKAALEGERKQVTVLFADLKGSMELLADRDPEEARKILDPVLERMMEAVHRYEGTVNQVMGDGIMALFGAPLAHEDHAVRACYAALRMQESVKKYAEEVRRSHAAVVKIRIGLNSGEVVVRAIGSDLHMDYTAVGQTAHLAARMEQIADPGSILMTIETLRLAEGFVQVDPQGLVTLKGLAAPVETFSVIGVSPARSRLQVAAARGLTKFVGHDTEMDTLFRALEQARSSHGQVVAVVGEPGVGKSRLAWEFTHSHRTHGWLILESAAVSYGKATPYLPVIELLKSYFKIQDRDDQREIRERVGGKLMSLDGGLASLLPPLLALLDVSVDDAAFDALDPPQRRQRTLDAVKRLVLRESQIKPLLLIFEDLHWIDSETQTLLDELIESLPTSRVLLLVNYRPEYQHSWNSMTYYRQLRIDPLPPENAEELLEGLLGNDAGLAPLKRLLIERTEGNPFFLEESVRTLIETGVLTGERGAHLLGKSVHALDIPVTAKAILAARIDRLAPEDKRLLQAASVIGKDLPVTLLQAIADEGEDVLHRGLPRLQAAEFLYEARLFPDVEYTFRHALTHEVAYGSLLQDRRRTLHARITEAIEVLYPERLTEQIDRLAHHAWRGEVWSKALLYSKQAGDKNVMHSAYREAVACYEQALSALRHLPETRDTSAQAIDLRLALRSALQPLGDLGQVLVYLREAEELAAALDDPRRLARIALFLSRYFSMTGVYDDAIAAAQRALAVATGEDEGDGILRALAHLNLGLAYERQSDYQRAIDSFGQTVAAFDESRHRERFGWVILPAVQSRAELAWCHAELGTFAAGRALGDEGRRIAEAVGHPLSLMVASWRSGLLSLRQGDLRTALPLLERAMDLSREADIPIWFPPMAVALGAAYNLSGRTADAVPLLTKALERATVMERPSEQASCHLHLGEAQLLAGYLKEAHAHAEDALTLFRERRERGPQAYALCLLGNITARHEPVPVELAAIHYQQARAFAEELGMRPLVAHCHLGLGKLYRRTGKRGQAQEHLTTATTMYREMDMRFWLKQAEAELQALT
jgi:class 3 adenylate cyclase/tetratricopeptide (TPR) repeat protein